MVLLALYSFDFLIFFLIFFNLFLWPQNPRLHYALATNKCPIYRQRSLIHGLSYKTIFLLAYAGKPFPGPSQK